MKTRIKGAVLGLGLAASLAGAALPLGSAQAAPSAQLIFAVDRAGDQTGLQQVQYFYGGRHFCWYDNAWSGPGYYWCGYAWRRGYGWGGGYGWRGWRGGFDHGRDFGRRGWDHGHGGFDHGGRGGHDGDHHR
jgi:hypothetical protein